MSHWPQSDKISFKSTSNNKNIYNKFSSSLVCAASVIVISVAISSAAFAQDVSSGENSKEGEILVTGSRIRSPNATSVSPINTVGSEELLSRGSGRIEDLINTLPQAFADQGGSNRGGGTGASGTATINLRNLGNQRTLVLIDGKRLMPGDPDRVSAQAPDINNIPSALVQRIDVVTGGASAVYGSDAIAGVVNFVMKKNFEGLQLDAQYGLYLHNNDNPISRVATAVGEASPEGSSADGGQVNLAATFGKNFGDGRGNVTAYVSYRKIQGIGTSDRDYSICGLTATASGYTCALSGSTEPAQFQLLNPATGLTRGSYTLDRNTGNTFRPYQTSDGYNIGDGYDLQAPDERINAGLLAHYEFSPSLDVYTELMFMNDKANIRISPTATFSGRYQINCSNPYLSAQQVNLLCTSVGLGPNDNAAINLGLRNATGGSRYDYVKHKAFRAVAGARGAIGSNWNYDVYAQYGRTDYSSYYTGDYSLSRMRNALQVVSGPNGPVCASGAAGCVPINIFSTNSISPAALDYVQVPATNDGYTRERIISASLTGSLGFASPFASNPVAVALGAEYRDEALAIDPDISWTSGDLTGGGRKLAVSGKFDVKELFGEIRIPLVEDKPFFQQLTLEAGARYSDYSNSGGVWTYKLGGDWEPVRGLRARASYQRAVRAPNVVELFAPQRQSIFTTLDPCEGAVPRATLAQCQLTGLTSAQYGTLPATNGQALGTLIGGNPDLDPESSDTKSFGIQYTPSFYPALTLSVDYFDIKVKDLIGTIPINLTLAQCVSTGDPYFCSLINRDPQTGSLVQSPNVYVVSTSLNTGSLATSGIDVALTTRFDLHKAGRIDLSFSGTWTKDYKVQTLPGLASYDCAGYFGTTCGQPVPEWRHRLRAAWTSVNGFQLSGTWRYIQGTKNDKANPSPFLAASYQPYDGKLRDVSYFDLATSIEVNESFTLRAGVNNMFDKDPPLTASLGGQTSNGSFFAGMYDPLGRYAFVGVTTRF